MGKKKRKEKEKEEMKPIYMYTYKKLQINFLFFFFNKLSLDEIMRWDIRVILLLGGEFLITTFVLLA